MVLHDAAEEVLCRAACAWAGVPLADPDARQRAREFGAMIDGSGAVGPRLLRGLALRRRTERWAREVVAGLRAAGIADTPAGRIAHHRDLVGSPLPVEVAAVELINVLRPAVAVGRYVTFAAHALHRHPGERDRVRNGGDEYRERFAQEVRRFYPFFPFVGGRALEPFTWRGHLFEPGAWVLLDLYGTTHDPRLWAAPGEFRPDRFAGRPADPFALVAQGGGDYATDHRCPGEPATVELIKEAARLLTEETRYQVPDQDLSIDLSRLPAQPASRFVTTTG